MTWNADQRLAAACVMTSFVGTTAPAWLLARVGAGLGGVCLFAQNVDDDEQVRDLCAELHAARDDVVIAVDEEGGDVTRLDAADGSDMPSPAAFGFVDDPVLTRSAFASLGARLSAAGIDLALSPCADVNSNERNPVIGVRSFGSTAGVAARHTAAAVEGLQDGGVAACVKHFPGHGDTITDTHAGQARVNAPLTELELRELVPFRAAIDASADAVMSAHIVATALDDHPASLSTRWSAYLREQLRFAGVIVTDALDMRAVAGDLGIDGVAAAAVGALRAGADLLCLGAEFDADSTDHVVRAVAAAIADGALDRDDLLRSAARITALRRGRVARRDGAGLSDCAAHEVARRAVTVTGRVPDGIGALIECRPEPSMANFNVTWGLGRHLAAAGWQVGLVSSAAEADGAIANVAADRIVVAIRNGGVHRWQRDVVSRVVASGVPTIVVELGWPAVEPYGADATIVSHGAARSSTAAVAELLSTTRLVHSAEEGG